jgi:hypothetical protein
MPTDGVMRKSILKQKVPTSQAPASQSALKSNVQFQAGSTAQTSSKVAAVPNPTAARADAGLKSQREIMDLIQKLDAEKANREKTERLMQTQIDELRKELKASESKSADLKVKLEDTERKLKTSERTISEMKVVAGTQAQIVCFQSICNLAIRSNCL